VSERERYRLLGLLVLLLALLLLLLLLLLLPRIPLSGGTPQVNGKSGGTPKVNTTVSTFF